ncbi:MAG TPA: hypothetical protein DCQ58_03125 [Saprospirales bacterium]|nr:hypothetical protein [Saprospirales bacterium]
MQQYKPKSFWQRPEGVTGAIALGGLALGAGFLIFSFLPQILAFAANTLGLAVIILAIGALVYMVLDPKMRNLVWFMYKSVMRWVTGLFVKLDPIGILKAYVQDLKENLKKMNRQISRLRGQMHQLKELIINNQKQIKSNLNLASEAKDENNKNVMILKTRQAGRLKESNIKLEDLYKKMEILYRVLMKMEENSQVMMEDVEDQVKVKEVERKAIRTSHSAMKSAMNIIAGNSDKRVMFDMALEAIAEDVSQKVGEMEQFMNLSENFMKSVDLQNGIFEEEGLKMLEKWENEGFSLLLGEEKADLLLKANDDTDVLDLMEKPKEKVLRESGHQNQYDNFFE